jgi:hypothetical protein
MRGSMADPVKAVAVIDGKEVEVTLKELPAGYIPESGLDERFKEKLTNRVASGHEDAEGGVAGRR